MRKGKLIAESSLLIANQIPLLEKEKGQYSNVITKID